MTHILRAPQIDLASVLAAQTPQIDLRLQTFESSTRNFLKAVSKYKNRAIVVITDRRNAQAAERKRVAEKTQAVEAETNDCKVREIELLADLEREREERKDGELSVAAFKRQLASLREKCEAIDAEIEQYRAITANLRREKSKERSTLKSQAVRASPEVQAYEQKLSCIIEGIEKNRLFVRFSNLDKDDLDREFNFVLDVSNGIYKIITMTPTLPTLPIFVEELNLSKDVYTFIQQVRHAYQVLLGQNSA